MSEKRNVTVPWGKSLSAAGMAGLSAPCGEDVVGVHPTVPLKLPAGNLVAVD
jgi:hypothetical protein